MIISKAGRPVKAGGRTNLLDVLAQDLPAIVEGLEPMVERPRMDRVLGRTMALAVRARPSVDLIPTASASDVLRRRRLAGLA